LDELFEFFFRDFFIEELLFADFFAVAVSVTLVEVLLAEEDSSPVVVEVLLLEEYPTPVVVEVLLLEEYPTPVVVEVPLLEEYSSPVVVEVLLLGKKVLVATRVPQLYVCPAIMTDEVQSLVIFGLLETELNIK